MTQQPINAPTPQISVILPAFNVREHIAEALVSVQTQDLDDLEIIVVDDGSTDGTADLVASEFPDLKLYRKENGGAATARNTGIRESHGQLIAFLDADDVWLPGKLRAQVTYMNEHPDARLICGGFDFWLPDEDGQFPSPWTTHPAIQTAPAEPELSGWVYHKLLLSNFVWTSTVVMRRSLIDEIGLFDESLRLGQDYDYWLRASRVTEIHRLKGVMALYRKHRGSATVQGKAMENHAARVLRNAVARWGTASPNGEGISDEALSDRLYTIHFSSGYVCLKTQRPTRAKNEFLSCLHERPRCWKSWGYLIWALLLTTRARLPRTISRRNV